MFTACVQTLMFVGHFELTEKKALTKASYLRVFFQSMCLYLIFQNKPVLKISCAHKFLTFYTIGVESFNLVFELFVDDVII